LTLPASFFHHSYTSLLWRFLSLLYDEGVVMTLTITLTQEEVRLRAAAQKEGIDPADLVRKLVTEHLPPTPDENAASIALLQSWLEEDATDDPDEVRQAQAELEAFKRALNAERERAGARLIYP
jgi:hypothetical protein